MSVSYTHLSFSRSKSSAGICTAKVLGQIVDWFYSQIVGFLGNFFSELGNMGAELFTCLLYTSRCV